MLAAVQSELGGAQLAAPETGGPSFCSAAEPTVLVMTAAVADWRPARRAARKLKKSEMSDTLKLVRNPDILKISL